MHSEIGWNQPLPDELARARHLEQAVAIGLPARAGQQRVLDVAVVALEHGHLLDLLAQVPGQRTDHRLRRQPRAQGDETQHARREDARAIDADHHELAARAAHGRVDGRHRRGRGGGMEQVVELRAEGAHLVGLERLVGAVVDHQHFVVQLLDAQLVATRQRMQRPRRFPAHVVADHHDR
nr:hypothetical protein [Lysobacter solisilvae]